MSPPAPTQGDGFCASRSSGPNTTTYRSSTDSPWRSAGTSGKRARNSSTVIGPGTARARSSRSRERRICTIGSLPARLYIRDALPREPKLSEETPAQRRREVAQLDFGGDRQAVRHEIDHNGAFHEALHRDEHPHPPSHVVPTMGRGVKAPCLLAQGRGLSSIMLPSGSRR